MKQQPPSSVATWIASSLPVGMIGGREPWPSSEVIGRRSTNPHLTRSFRIIIVIMIVIIVFYT